MTTWTVDSSVHGILQARILERAAIPISRRSSWSRDWTGVFCGSCIAGRPFTAEPLHLHYSLKAFSDSVVLIKWRPFSLTWFISASQFSFPTSSQMLFELVVVPQRTCFVFSYLSSSHASWGSEPFSPLLTGARKGRTSTSFFFFSFSCQQK